MNRNTQGQTPIICYITNPRTEPHTTIPPPGLYVSQRQRLFIHALEESMEHCEPKYTGTDTNHLLYHQPTDGAPHDNTPPRVVCITAAEIIYPCPRSMEHCEPKYTGTPIIHLPVGFITNPRTEPHTTIPRGCMYHSGGDYLSMPYHHIYYGISKK